MFIRRLTDYQRLEKGLAYRQVIDAAGATIAFSPSDVRATVAILKGYGQEGVIGPNRHPKHAEGEIVPYHAACDRG